MSKISDAILDSLLETITDYENVAFSEGQYGELQDICDQWEDKESIETEINRFLLEIGYKYNDECKWELVMYVTKSDFLDFYFNTGDDGSQHDMRVNIGYEVVDALLEGKEYKVPTVEELFDSCGYIRAGYIKDYEKYKLDDYDEFEDFRNIKLID